MKCPKCRGESRVLRTGSIAEGKKRSRQCISPLCGSRFITTERNVDTNVDSPSYGHDRMIASLKDGRGYDREALTAALNTDRRRAEIARAARAQRQDDDYEMDTSTPSRLSWFELRGWLGR